MTLIPLRGATAGTDASVVVPAPTPHCSSGQVVRGAPKDKDKRRAPGGVEDIFEGARAAGAEQGSYEDMLEEDEGGQRFRAFSGAARTLAGALGWQGVASRQLVAMVQGFWVARAREHHQSSRAAAVAMEQCRALHEVHCS